MATPVLDRIAIELQDQHDDASRIGDFLFLFRAIYAAAIEALGEERLEQPFTDEMATEVVSYIQTLKVKELDRLFSVELGENRLRVESMSHRNPFEIVLAGVAGAVLVGIFVCGGKVKLGITGVEVDTKGIQTIPETIAKMRSLLTSTTPIDIGYGARPKAVVLTSDQLQELRRPEKGQGGFQRFLKRLRSRVSKTGRLTLLPSEIAQIQRYATRGQGGFQTRIRRIFGATSTCSAHALPLPSER